MYFVLLVTGVLTVCAGALFFTAQRGSSIETLVDEIWWAITTMTTVGYGDIAPVTPEKDMKEQIDELRREVPHLRRALTHEIASTMDGDEK